MSQIPSIHEPFINPQGNVMTRTWYRVINALTKQSGSLAQPILVKPNSFFVSGDLNSGSSLEPATIPNSTVLGNSSGAAADATPQAIDASLSLSGGILSVAKLAALSLFGNADNVTASPSGIAIGKGLAILPTTPPQLVAVSPTTNPDLTAAQVLSWWRG